ncbi:class I SAM-dependent methyltransferase [Nocardioides korecus]
MSTATPPPARSFGEVADAYDRARPSYPDEAVTWMAGTPSASVLELGAGTGKLTEVLARAGHSVLATDPLPAMLRHLGSRVRVAHVAASAEHVPLRSRSVDRVVAGQAFHWFDHDLALAEAARVLRPGGVLALAWNTYDTSIPWVRRLERLLTPPEGREQDRSFPLKESPYFGFVEERSFRFWQVHTSRSLLDLARSVSYVATMPEPEREALLAQVATLYADYGRGHDGMQLPWVTRCYRAVVRHQELPEEAPAPQRADRPEDDAPRSEDEQEVDEQTPAPTRPRRPPEDPGMQLIDFR